MGERAPYSRVYWSVVDDPKFEGIYDDDRHLATWLRLLIAADAIWPASATLPANARKASIEALGGSGLVDLLPGRRYRIHGLDAERGRRREAASRVPSGDHSDPKRLPDGLSRTRDAMLGSSSLGSAPARANGKPPEEEKPFVTLTDEEKAERLQAEKDETIRRAMLRVGLKPEPAA